MSNTFYTSCAHVFFPSLTSKGPVYCNILPVTLLALHILASPTLSSYWINWYMLFHTQSAMTAYASSSSDCGAKGNLSHTRSSSSNSLTTLCALSTYSLWISLDFHLLGSVRTPISEFTSHNASLFQHLSFSPAQMYLSSTFHGLGYGV